MASSRKVIEATPDDPLYHITFAANLPGIAEHGLRSGGRGIGGIALAGHKRGRIFLTELEGVSFWTERAEQLAADQSDDILGDELIPVVIKVEDPPEELEHDAIGTKDSGGHDAYYCACTIEPDDLQVWDGSDWIDLADHGSIDLDQAVDEDGYLVESPLTELQD